MGLFSMLGSVVGLLVVVAGGGAAYLYATDYQLDATVTGTDCANGEVGIQTKLFSIDHTMKDVPAQQCAYLEKGNYVEYNLRSKHTVVFDVEGGLCKYDSADPARCAANNFPL